MTSLVNRAVTLVRTHPDAERVTVRVESKVDITAEIDTRQMERAVYNLLLNACQSARQSSGRREVSVAVDGDVHRLRAVL